MGIDLFVLGDDVLVLREIPNKFFIAVLKKIAYDIQELKGRVYGLGLILEISKPIDE
jgi:hypothetical protein